MRFQRIYEAVHYKPWFITAGSYETVKNLLDSAMKGELKGIEGNSASGPFADFVRERPSMVYDQASGIATISIFGVLALHMSNIEKSCGNTGFEEIENEINQAVSMGAKGVMFDFDSPGGTVVGADECAKAIANAPVVTAAFSDSLSCSCSYYLMSGCNVVTVTRSAIVGNIGVICPWIDRSKLWELNGVQFDGLTNEGADLKSTFHGPSLTDSQRQFLQDDINQAATLFQNHVLTHRQSIDSEVWRAGWYSGERAQSLGLVDFIGNRADAYANLKSLIG